MRPRFLSFALIFVTAAPSLASADEPLPSPLSPPTALPAEPAPIEPAPPAPLDLAPPPIRQDLSPRPTPVPGAEIKRGRRRMPSGEIKGVDGQPPPEGYHEVRKLQRYPFVLGPAFFGASYLCAIGGGLLGSLQSGRPDLWNAMYIPAVGPFITLDRARPTFSDDIDAALVATAGVFQIVGLGLTVTGFFLPKRVLWRMDDRTRRSWEEREQEWEREDQRPRARLRDERDRAQASDVTWTLQPLVLPRGGGLGVIGAW